MPHPPPPHPLGARYRLRRGEQKGGGGGQTLRRVSGRRKGADPRARGGGATKVKVAVGWLHARQQATREVRLNMGRREGRGGEGSRGPDFEDRVTDQASHHRVTRNIYSELSYSLRRGEFSRSLDCPPPLPFPSPPPSGR